MDTWVSYGISAEYEVIFGFKIYWLGKLPSPSSPAHKEMFLRDSRPLCGDPGARACLLSLNVGVTNGCVGNLKWEDGLQHIRSHPWLSDSLAPLLIFWALSHFRGSDSDVGNGVSCFSLIVAPTLCLRGSTLDVKDSFTRQAGSWNCPWEQKKTGLCGERFSSAWLRSFFGQRKLRRAARWWRRQLENKTASIVCNEIARPKFYFVILTAFVYPWLGSR